MLSRELQEACAALRARPFFVLNIVATLGVTLGILLCMVNLNHVLLLKELPYPNQERLVVGVGNVYAGSELKYPDMVAYPMAEYLEKKADVAALAILNFGQDIVTSIPERPRLRLTNATPKYFDMLGVGFAKGGPFAAEHGIGSKEPVAILSYQTWQKYFAASDGILAERLVISGVTYRIIGVTAPAFIEPELFQAGARTDIWLPWEFNAWQQDMRTTWASFTDQIKVLASLEPGQSRAQARQMLESLVADRFAEATKGSAYLRNAQFKFEVEPLKSYLVEDGRIAALLFLASSLALVIIACINVFNLLLSRAAEQQRQLAIRATLGANRRHIFHKVLAEHLVLISLSMLTALLLAAVVTQALKSAIRDQLPRMGELSLSPVTVLVAVVMVAALAGLFSGIMTRTIDYRRLAGLINSSGKGTGLQVSANIRKSLIASQIAMAAFLLVAIASVLKVSHETVTRPPGFRVDNAVFAVVSPGAMQINDQEGVRYVEEIKAQLLRLPQVNRVSNSAFVPMMTNRWTTEVKVDPAGTDSLSAGTNMVDEDYLAVMDQQILAGSNFSRDDVNFDSRKALVNETLARKISPAESPVGKQIYWSGDDQQPRAYQVLGVVKDLSVPRMPQTGQLYVTRFATELNFIVEVKPGQELSRQEFLNVLNGVNSNFNLFDYQGVRSLYDGLTLKDRFIIWLAIALGVLTIMLASLGIYGVLNYGIQLRRYEFGVRMSIGAGPTRIAGLVYRENLVLFLVGGFASLCILVVCNGLLAWLADYRLPLTFGTSAVGYLIIAVSVALACYLPLRAIIRRWPVFALRTP